MSPRKARSAVPLTEARARLFQLVEELLTGRRDRVVLSHREHEEQVVLLRIGDVERMEGELAALRRRNAVSEPRPLWGIATIVGDPETIVEEIRAEANRQAEKRMREFCGDEPVPEASAESQAPRTGTQRRGPRARKSTP
jgi:hypothetical protein